MQAKQMHSNDKKHQHQPPYERTAYLTGITFIGGFINAYGYCTRDGILPNNHTGNMSRLGIGLATADWSLALDALIPIIATVLGAVCTEAIRALHARLKPEGFFGGDWRKMALAFELVFLFAMGLIPPSAPSVVVGVCLSFIAGYQLCLFRAWFGEAHNTTICTGNLRGIGQRIFHALNMRTAENAKKLGLYAIVVFSFPLGGTVATWLSSLLGTYAIWICCLMLMGWTMWLDAYETRSSRQKPYRLRAVDMEAEGRSA